jgi:hypothetical protein
MRVVLAVDELLGHKIKKTLRAHVEIFPRVRLRLEGPSAALASIEQSPCVLAAGAAEWDPLAWLEDQGIPADVPKVVIVPEANEETVRRAISAGVRAIVPATVSGIALATSAACQIAWNDRGKIGLLPILVVPDRHGKRARKRIRGQQTKAGPTLVAPRRA